MTLTNPNLPPIKPPGPQLSSGGDRPNPKTSPLLPGRSDNDENEMVNVKANYHINPVAGAQTNGI